MKKLSTLYTILLLLSLLTGCTTSEKRNLQVYNKVGAVDSTLTYIVKEQEVPGISLAVFNDKEVLFQKAAGSKNAATGEPVDSLTAFEAASLSKSLFAYLLVRSVEKGAFALDAPVSSFNVAPAIKKDSRHELLTPLNLLSHTSGLPNWRGAPNLQATHFAELFLPEDSLKLGFEPGTNFSYSGEGYLYLQQVLEKATAKRLNALAREEVFTPLQMARSSFLFDSATGRNFATGHDVQGNPGSKYQPRLALAAASLHTTAGDYAKFLVKLVGKVKAGGLYGQMSEEAVAVEENEEYRIAWGLGIGIMEFQGKRYLFHWGDNGDFKSYYLYCMDDNVGFVYFANGENGLSIRNKLSRSVFGYEIPMWPADYVE